MRVNFSKVVLSRLCFAGTFGLLRCGKLTGVLRPPAAGTKLQKFPYALLKHNLATRFVEYYFCYSLSVVL